MQSVEELTAPTRGEGGALSQIIWGFAVSQAVSVAARLGVADALSAGPRSAGELAEALRADEAALGRLLRALTSVGVLVEDERGRYAATPVGDLLRSDHPHSQRAFACLMGAPFVWRTWGALDLAIATGKPAFDAVYGETFFEHFGRVPEDAALFQAAMGGLSRDELPHLLDAYDFSRFRTIVDVGGGEGTLLRGILERCPNTRGILFDLPPVVAAARDLMASAVGARCDGVAGDMFQSVPPGANAYVLSHILHDWSDEDAVRILRHCRRAIADDGKLLVVELVIAPPNQPDFAKWLDLNMLALLTGRERTEAEFRHLFARAGFELSRVVPTGGRAIIEGVPVSRMSE